MDADRADLAGVVETGELPGLAAVGRLVDAAAGGDVAADAVGSGSDIDDAGVRVRHRDRSGGSDRDLAVGDRDPARAAVGRAEHAAAGDTHIKGARLRRHAGDRRHASAAGGPDQAVAHPLEERGIDAGAPWARTRAARSAGRRPARAGWASERAGPERGACPSREGAELVEGLRLQQRETGGCDERQGEN